MQKYQLLIAGRWVDAAAGKTFEDINPATGEVLANVCEADTEDKEKRSPWLGVTSMEKHSDETL